MVLGLIEDVLWKVNLNLVPKAKGMDRTIKVMKMFLKMAVSL